LNILYFANRVNQIVAIKISNEAD